MSTENLPSMSEAMRSLHSSDKRAAAAFIEKAGGRIAVLEAAAGTVTRDAEEAARNACRDAHGGVWQAYLSPAMRRLRLVLGLDDARGEARAA